MISDLLHALSAGFGGEVLESGFGDEGVDEAEDELEVVAVELVVGAGNLVPAPEHLLFVVVSVRWRVEAEPGSRSARGRGRFRRRRGIR